jgi:hypothetical protein
VQVFHVHANAMTCKHYFIDLKATTAQSLHSVADVEKHSDSKAQAIPPYSFDE